MILESEEGVLRGDDRSFATRSDRGWMPPSVDDVDTVTRERAEGRI